MKRKRNNQGFILIETLVVSSVVLTTLVLIYSQFSKVNQNYSNTYIFNNINDIYALRQIVDYVSQKKLVYKLTSDLSYLDISDGTDSSIYGEDNNSAYTDDLFSAAKVKTLLLTRNSKVYLYGALSENNPYSLKLQRFVKSIDDSDDSYKYRLVAEFEDGTFATVPFLKTKGPLSVYCPSGICDDGTPMYFDPEKNVFCDQSLYVAANSLNGNVSGCMRWYAYGDEGGSKFRLLLDHNTTRGYIMDDTLTDLKNWDEFSTWYYNIKSTVAPMTSDDLSKIIDIPVGDMDGIYFESKTKTMSTIPKGTAKYRWLYNYLSSCETYGCDVNDSSSDEGYWLSKKSSMEGFAIYYDGSFGASRLDTDRYGVRPTIEINKTKY